MKYKVGDKVRIKSLDWYNENKTKHEAIWFDNAVFVGGQSLYCGCELTIRLVTNDSYYVIENDYYWIDEMIEGLVEEETKPNTIEEAKTYWDSIKDAWICPEGYIFKDENGNIINATKIVLEKKKKEVTYPKTYKECCDILKQPWDKIFVLETIPENHTGLTESEIDLFKVFIKLKRCRDAYWKIAGEEMGLGKPWKPDWTAKDNHFYTIHTFNGKIECSATAHRNAVLIFPTSEMRDAFYEAFKKEIEICKDLL